MSDYCYICGRGKPLHRHHIYAGSLRNTSERMGAVVMLCPSCHTTGKFAVHNDPKMNLWLKQVWQREFEKTHTREDFIKLFRRNYLD